MKKLPQDIENLIAHLKSKDDLDLVLYFGSFSKGIFHAASDFDVGIAKNKKMSWEEFNQVMQELSEITDRKIDLVDLHAIHPPLLQEIFHEHTWIKKNSSIFAKILFRGLMEAADYLPIKMRAQKNKIKSFLK